jgi:hypothetical protein
MWKEITIDNLDELYENKDRLMICCDGTYGSYDCWCTTLTTMAKIGEYYAYIVPEFN